ncbi:MAG: methyl-accepting chemotaxis protein [Acidobacteria bacterium]|nr:methyl-accepting chemotaxis protein [Acidobacteriota bacterium]
MNWFLNLTIRTKLLLCFGVLILLLGAAITTAYTNLKALQEAQKKLFEKDFLGTIFLYELRSDLSAQRFQGLEMTLSSRQIEQETLERDIRGRAQRVDETLALLFTQNRDDLKFISELQDLKTTLSEFRQTRETVISLVAAGKLEEARQLTIGGQKSRFDKIQTIALELEKDSKDRINTAMARSDQRIQDTNRLLLIIGVIEIGLALIMIILLNQTMAIPLRQISVLAEQIAQGDLTATGLPANRADEVGILTKTFQTMTDRLRQLTLELQEGINVLATSASEILATTTQISVGAAETATAVTETTTTVEEVKQTALVTAQKAKLVSDNAQKTIQVSQNGKKSIEQSLEGMHRIQNQMEAIVTSIVRLSEQNQAISEIIVSVNDLAEQSNLLAVNAAIEAAKAGEYGKGFTVVAQEIKTLAEQSKQATTQVRTILADIQKAMNAATLATEQGSKAVEAGVKQSVTAGESIRMLAESISEAAQSATQIAASSQQQLVGMDQVVQAMDNIKQVTTQNVAGTKQTELAANNLYELGQSLKRLADRYQA